MRILPLQKMKSLCVALLAVALTAAAENGPWIQPDDAAHQQTVEQLLTAIRAKLPNGWTASYDKKNSWLAVTHTEEVLLDYPEPPNSAPDSKSEGRGTFDFTFRVVSFVSVAEYRRLALENARIEQERSLLYDDLLKRRVAMWMGYDNFRPSNDEETKLVAKYEAVKKSAHVLPDLYFRDISLEWVFNSPNLPHLQHAPRDPAVKAECARVEEALTKVMTKYVSAEKPNQ